MCVVWCVCVWCVCVVWCVCGVGCGMCVWCVWCGLGVWFDRSQVREAYCELEVLPDPITESALHIKKGTDMKAPRYLDQARDGEGKTASRGRGDVL